MSMCPVAGPSGQTMDQQAVLSMVRPELEDNHHSELILFYEKSIIIVNDNHPLYPFIFGLHSVKIITENIKIKTVGVVGMFSS